MLAPPKPPLGNGLDVTTSSDTATPAFCGGLGGPRSLAVNRALTKG